MWTVSLCRDCQVLHYFLFQCLSGVCCKRWCILWTASLYRNCQLWTLWTFSLDCPAINSVDNILRECDYMLCIIYSSYPLSNGFICKGHSLSGFFSLRQPIFQSYEGKLYRNLKNLKFNVWSRILLPWGGWIASSPPSSFAGILQTTQSHPLPPLNNPCYWCFLLTTSCQLLADSFSCLQVNFI